MVMAWWRGAPYASRMRFFRDSDAETPVQWKLARRGAKDFPLYHLFHLSVLEDRPTGPRWPVGEVPGSVRAQKVWRRSTLPGVCYTGTPDQWAGGCLLSDPVPAKDPCCLPPWVLPVPVVIGLDFLWGTVVTLLVEQYDGTGRVPTVTTLDFDQASRLVVDSLGPGHAGVRWLGVRGYHAGDGYFGPQPDVEFRDGGGLTWAVSQDAANKRVVVSGAVQCCEDVDGGTTEDTQGGMREGGAGVLAVPITRGGMREGGALAPGPPPGPSPGGPTCLTAADVQGPLPVTQPFGLADGGFGWWSWLEPVGANPRTFSFTLTTATGGSQNYVTVTIYDGCGGAIVGGTFFDHADPATALVRTFPGHRYKIELGHSSGVGACVGSFTIR